MLSVLTIHFSLPAAIAAKHHLFPVAQENEHGQQAKQAPCHRRELQTGHTDVFTAAAPVTTSEGTIMMARELPILTMKLLAAPKMPS